MQKKIKIKGDIDISAVVHEPEGQKKGVVIALHGFESFKDSPKYVMMGEEFEKNGFYFVRFDFRGCGETEGDKYDLEGRIKDAKAVIKFAKENLDENRIYLVGSSLGGTVAILLGDHAKGLVALCPPKVNIGRLKIEDALQKNPPILIIHGDKDETVDIKEGLEIFNLARPPKEFFKVEGGDHRFTNPEHLKLVIEKTAEFVRKLNSQR